MEGDYAAAKGRVQNQPNSEWLDAHEGKITPVALRTFKPLARPVASDVYRFIGYSTRKDKKHSGRLVMQFANVGTGEVVNAFFNVNIQYQRGNHKNDYFRTGENGRFWLFPKSKFSKLWIEAIGWPVKFSTIYRQMSKLKQLHFTGKLDIKPTYKQLIDVVIIAKQ